MKKVILIVLTAVILIACTACDTHNAPFRSEQPATTSAGQTTPTKPVDLSTPQDVSLIQLIATPEKYDGTQVRVIGVADVSNESLSLCLSKDDWYYRTYNALWVEFGQNAPSYHEARLCNGEYVIVEGAFNMHNSGDMGMYCGAIEKVSRYEKWDAYLDRDITDFADVIRNDDQTYSYTITGTDNTVLLSETGCSREPHIQLMDTRIVEVLTQTGTGLSTNQAVYVDVENGEISDMFRYVLGAANGKVVYVEHAAQTSSHQIVVRHIFDDAMYYKTYDLQTDVALSQAIVKCEMRSSDVLTITYVKDEGGREYELTVSVA